MVRLPRYLELEQIGLGMSRDQVMPALPVGQAIIKQNIPEGISVTFAGKLPHDLNYVVRQMFLRFDATEHLAEIRFRYAAGSTGNQSATWHKELLAGLKKQGGAPQETISSWKEIWSDLPVQQPAPVRYTWRDDRTLMQCQCDAGGAEVTLHDCPLAYPAGVPLPALQFLPRDPRIVYWEQPAPSW